MLKDTLAAISAVAGALAEQGIGKSSRNREQGFNFRGIDSVLHALSPLLVHYGLVILPRVVSRQDEERITTKGSKMRSVAVTVEYTINHTGGERDDAVTVAFTGEAMDSGDKATNKAMSAAFKYMAIQTFCIPVDAASVPDADADSPGGADEDRNSERHSPRAARRTSGESGPHETAATDNNHTGSAQSINGSDEQGAGQEVGTELTEGQGQDVAVETLNKEQAVTIRDLLSRSGYSAEKMLSYYKTNSVENLPASVFKSIKTTLERIVKARANTGGAQQPATFRGVRE